MNVAKSTARNRRLDARLRSRRDRALNDRAPRRALRIEALDHRGCRALRLCVDRNCRAQIVVRGQQSALLAIEPTRCGNHDGIEPHRHLTRMWGPRRAMRAVVGVRGPRHRRLRGHQPAGPAQRRQRFEHGLVAQCRRGERTTLAEPAAQRRLCAFPADRERYPQRRDLDRIEWLLDRHRRPAEPAVRRAPRCIEGHRCVALGTAEDLRTHQPHRRAGDRHR